MSLNTFTHAQDGLNAHLNIGADSVSSVNSSSVIHINLGAVNVYNTPGSITLSASDVISATIAIGPSGGAYNFTCPSAADINTALGTLNLPSSAINTSFQTEVYTSVGTSGAFGVASSPGVTLFGTGATSFSVPALTGSTLTWFQNTPTTWQIMWQ